MFLLLFMAACVCGASGLAMWLSRWSRGVDAWMLIGGGLVAVVACGWWITKNPVWRRQ